MLPTLWTFCGINSASKHKFRRQVFSVNPESGNIARTHEKSDLDKIARTPENYPLTPLRFQKLPRYPEFPPAAYRAYRAESARCNAHPE